ncbi:hypothetical protein V2G26_016439 [Clonostachys chloroleuca]
MDRDKGPPHRAFEYRGLYHLETSHLPTLQAHGHPIRISIVIIRPRAPGRQVDPTSETEGSPSSSSRPPSWTAWVPSKMVMDAFHDKTLKVYFGCLGVPYFLSSHC